MKKIAILLHSNIRTDYRVIRIMRTLATKFELYLFFHGQKDDVLDHFMGYDNIHCFALQERISLKQKILRHSLFCYEYLYLIDEVLNHKIKFDYVWANDLPTLYPASKIAKILDAKLIYDSHEIFIETLNQFFPRKAFFLKKLVFDSLLSIMRYHGRYIEQRELKRSVYKLITVNEALKNYFIKIYKLDPENVLAVYNYTVTNDHKRLYFSDRLSIASEDAKIILYQGLLNEGRALRQLVTSIKYLNHKAILLIVGNGPLKTDLEKLAEELKIRNNIMFIDESPENYYVKIADMGISLFEDYNLSKKFASPNKVFQYINGLLPVVMQHSQENQKVIDSFDIGELTSIEPTDIAKHIDLVLGLGKEHYKINLEKAKDFYVWENHEQKLISFILG